MGRRGVGRNPGGASFAWGACVWIGLLAACAPAMPPATATPRGRFEWSLDRYERGKYHDAIRGFRDHLLREPLHPTADSSRLLLAESYLETDQELLAANEFRQMTTSRPNSPLADDAQFGICRSYWAVSPDLPRDQEFTEKTIEECTRLLEFFPRSSLVGEARDLVAQARQKAAAKELRVGKYYYDRGFYESAIIYLENILQTYPEADVVPETLLVLHDSYYQVGFRMEADAVRQRLLELYPDSRAAKSLPERDEDEG
ncbi:MAG: outer membrane protein assembly factor BamD [Gemmatimonadetes bacterium]|nr:outer membrane protein assembly factor BamD [Gemmatimonadota bacterium]